MAVSVAGNAIPTKDSYFSGMGSAIAKGELDSSRLVGNEGRTLGNGGFVDKSLSAVLGGLSSFLPGVGPVGNLLAGSLTTPASGTGQLINDLNVSVGNNAPTWMPSGSARVAEYFYKENKEETLVLLSDGRTLPPYVLRCLPLP